MEQDAENRRVYWHSRRGMLELDLVLMPFAETVYPTLDAQTQALYRELLGCEDADLFAWLVHGVAPEDPRFPALIRRILGNGRPRDPHPAGVV